MATWPVKRKRRKKAATYTGAHQALRDLEVFGDLDHHVLMARRPGTMPLLIAGIRDGPPGDTDGIGNRCAFASPAAVVITPEGLAYVADYEANRIRRVRLPRWLVEGAPVPALGRGGRFGR